MNCKKCGCEISDEKVCPSCGEEVSKRIKKRVLIPVIAFVFVAVMGVCMFLVGYFSERRGLEETLENDAWFTAVGENEFVVIKFDDGRFAMSRISGSDTDATIENYSYRAISDKQFKIEDDVYSVRFDKEGMEVFPGIADKEAENELWYHIED